MDLDKMEEPCNYQSNQQIIANSEYTLYKRRWYLLATLALLNISNALQWLAFAPVAYTAAEFYNTNVNIINLLSVVFMIVGIPCGIFATWLLDTFGLRLSIIMSAWLNFIGSLIRIVSALPGIDEGSRIPLVFVGSVLAALAQPFMLFAPTKLAALWFPENQRAIANMIATMCNPLGIMLAGILSPILAPDASKILFMLSIESIPGILAVVMATVGVCSSQPPTPPSASAESPSEPFLVGVKALFRNKAYWLLAWAVGGGIGLFSVLTTLLSQMLCPWGYDDNFAGVVCTGALIGAGLVGGIGAGIIVDNTKRYIRVTKICYVIAVLALIAFSVMHSYPNLQVPIAVSLGAFGFFGLPVYPIGNELSVETTYPVGEATSSGILFMFGQLQGILLVVILSALGQKLPNDFPGQVCTAGNPDIEVYDMTIPAYVMTGYAVVVMLVFVLVFRTRYRRLEAEQANTQDSSEEGVSAESPVHENVNVTTKPEGTAFYSSGTLTAM